MKVVKTRAIRALQLLSRPGGRSQHVPRMQGPQGVVRVTSTGQGWQEASGFS